MLKKTKRGKSSEDHEYTYQPKGFSRHQLKVQNNISEDVASLSFPSLRKTSQ